MCQLRQENVIRKAPYSLYRNEAVLDGGGLLFDCHYMQLQHGLIVYFHTYPYLSIVPSIPFLLSFLAFGQLIIITTYNMLSHNNFFI